MSAPEPTDDVWPEVFDQRSGARIRNLPAHGTYAGYNRHVRMHEPPCAACRRAATEYQRTRRDRIGMNGRAGEVREELARLQARWDARVEELRALIEQWRSTAGVLSVHYDATGEGELRGRSKVYQIAADELERAIGGGRG